MIRIGCRAHYTSLQKHKLTTDKLVQHLTGVEQAEALDRKNH
jgi:hypothetical protein